MILTVISVVILAIVFVAMIPQVVYLRVHINMILPFRGEYKETEASLVAWSEKGHTDEVNGTWYHTTLPSVVLLR